MKTVIENVLAPYLPFRLVHPDNPHFPLLTDNLHNQVPLLPEGVLTQLISLLHQHPTLSAITKKEPHQFIERHAEGFHITYKSDTGKVLTIIEHIKE